VTNMSYVFSVMCIVCHKSHEGGPGKGWDTVSLGDAYDYHRCGQCAAQGRLPASASGQEKS
jgi:hypothetical protein